MSHYRRPLTPHGIRPRKIIPEPSAEYTAARKFLGKIQEKHVFSLTGSARDNWDNGEIISNHQIKWLAKAISDKGLDAATVVGKAPLTEARANDIIKQLDHKLWSDFFDPSR